jgi:Ribosome biogenesis protein SLX9
MYGRFLFNDTTTRAIEMPKVSKVGKFRNNAVTISNKVAGSVSPSKEDDRDRSVSAKTSNDREANALENEDGLSRGQRKRQVKKDQYMKRQKLVLSTLMLKRREEQSKRIDGLNALKEALLGTLQENPKMKIDNNAPSFTTNFSKQKLVVQEVSHLGLVLEHPAFRSNPFATIQEHLKNSLSEQAKIVAEEGVLKARQKLHLAEQRQIIKKDKRHHKHKKKSRATRI